MCYEPCLYQAIHYLFYSDLYAALDLLVVQVILVYDLLGNDLA